MIGQALSHFRITALLGEGGMGSVYRAEDTRLGRDVAIKVLPEAFTQDQERLARFEREAQILATLNHPHIAAIYEVGHAAPASSEGDRASERTATESSSARHFLVMELAEGETLQELLDRGAIPVDRALRIGRQIANALEAAHDRNVIHRDLKPANIKITPDGNVKVLDFGLAKAWAPASGDAEVTNSPTLTAQMTQAGVILGTAAYMSPEQARGEELDKRTDIWSFGCVLFEMLTGRKSFAGQTVTDILASVVKDQPDLSLLPGEVPSRVARLLGRCLEKNANDRLRDIGDARIELSSTAEEGATQEPEPRSEMARGGFGVREMASWAFSLLLLAALGWVLFSGARGVREPVASEVIRFRIADPAADLSIGTFNQSLLAISPDGRHIVYPARIDDEPQLVLRSLDSLEARPIPESEGATDPFFSPDGRSVAFFSGFNGVLRVAPLQGLLPTDLVSVGQNRGASWADDGSIIYAPNFSSGLWRVLPDTGESSAITEPAEEDLERSHRWPEVLPGSRAALFTVLTADIQSSDEAHIDAVDLSTGERKTVLRNASYARYSPPGRLLFVRGSHLLSVGFDTERVEVIGQPEVLIQNIVTLPLSGAALYAISTNGTLAYVSGDPLVYRRRVVRYGADLSSRVVSERAEPFQTLRLSPDERFLAVGIDSINQSIWKLDLERDTMIRITHQWGHNDAEWLPDQSDLLVHSGRRGVRNVYRVAADGSGVSEQLTTGTLRKLAGSVTPDGSTYIYVEADERGNLDLWSVPTNGGTPESLLPGPFDQAHPKVSPDGRWLAFVSNESGSPEIYVQALDGGGKVRVSTSGGFSPEWGKDGRRLYFIQPGPPDWLISVPVELGSRIAVGDPQNLLELTDQELGARTFDTTSDGGFFILRDETPDYSAEPLIVVRGWTSELKARSNGTN